MGIVAYLDTHVAARLRAGETERITAAAQRVIEECELRISPIVYLEFDYLFRRKRTSADAPTMYSDLNTSFGVQICSLPFPLVAAVAIECDWSSDPFDKLIVGHAMANHNAPLITSDRLIRQHYKQAVW